MSFKKDVRQSLTDIKVELGKNTVTLMDHHVRSSNLESRMKPIEDHVVFINRTVKVILSVATFGAAIAAIAHYFSK